MNIDEIRNNAPYGATHYDNNGKYYIVRVKTVAWSWDNNWQPVMFQITGDIKPLH